MISFLVTGNGRLYLGVIDDVHLFDVGRVALDGGASAAQVHQTGGRLVHLGTVIHAAAGQHLWGGGGIAWRPDQTSSRPDTSAGNIGLPVTSETSRVPHHSAQSPVYPPSRQSILDPRYSVGQARITVYPGLLELVAVSLVWNLLSAHGTTPRGGGGYLPTH